MPFLRRSLVKKNELSQAAPTQKNLPRENTRNYAELEGAELRTPGSEELETSSRKRRRLNDSLTSSVRHKVSKGNCTDDHEHGDTQVGTEGKVETKTSKRQSERGGRSHGVSGKELSRDLPITPGEATVSLRSGRKLLEPDSANRTFGGKAKRTPVKNISELEEALPEKGSQSSEAQRTPRDAPGRSHESEFPSSKSGRKATKSQQSSAKKLNGTSQKPSDDETVIQISPKDASKTLRSSSISRPQRRRQKPTDNITDANDAPLPSKTSPFSVSRSNRRRQNATDNHANEIDQSSEHVELIESPKQTNGQIGSEEESGSASEVIEVVSRPKTQRKNNHYAENENLHPNIDTPSKPSTIKAPPNQTDQSEVIPPSLLKILTNHTLSRLTSRSPIPTTSAHQPPLHQLLTLMRQTIAQGESNSLILTGARSSGKSALVDHAIAQMRADPSLKSAFHVVRLNGMLQTDTRLALRELLRQLGREIAAADDHDDDESDTEELLQQPPTSDADALTTLLAMLTHTPDSDPASTEPTHQATTEIPKSLIILLDNFHLFCTHPRQTLLYNLFNLASTNSSFTTLSHNPSSTSSTTTTTTATGVPLLILGLTPTLSPADLLEKRVKSRFSSRTLYVPLPARYAELLEICASAVTLTVDDVADAAVEHAGNLANHLDRWNSLTASLLAHPLMTQTLHRIHTTSNSPSQALTSLYLPISHLHKSTCPSPSQTLLPPSTSPPLTLLPSLSTLQLGLLICTARLELLHSNAQKAQTAFTFSAAYAEYAALVTSPRVHAAAASAPAPASIGNRPFGRGVARMAWEGLVESGMLVGGGTGGSGSMGAATAIGTEAFRSEASLEEMVLWLGGKEGGTENEGLARWCRI